MREDPDHDHDGPGPEHRPAQTAAVRASARQGVAVAAATAVYGLSLGAVAVAGGLSVWQACVTSLLLFSGGSQFALVGVLGAGGTGTAAVAASTLLGVRNGLYGMQLAALPGLAGMPWRRRWLAAHVTIDESTAVAVGGETPRAARVGFWVTGLGVFAGWNLTTLVGALAGSAVGDPRRWGLDAAAPAAFLALLWPRLGTASAVRTALAAAVVAAALVPVLPTGLPIVATALVAVVAGWRRGGAHR